MTTSNSLPTNTRQALLDELAGLTSIERGTLFEEYRTKAGADGSAPTKLGPYFKHQCWTQRKNRSARVSAVEVPALRQDLENGKRFLEITEALADMAIAESRAKRKALTPAAAEASAFEFVAKKNSKQNASKKGIAKPSRSIQVQTLFGVLTLKRNYYYHTMAGTGRCPLDQALDLLRGCTPGVARLICRAASISCSYEDAAADLLAYGGLELCGRNFGRFVAEATPSLLQAQASQTPSQGGTIDVMYVSEDGTGVPLRRAELMGVKGKQSDGTARTREAKLGCVFTQTITNEEGEQLRDPDSTTYVGTFEGCRQSGILLRAEALRRGYARAKTTVYLGDGAHWIWENARQNFPDAVLILDFYHASEHLGVLATALHGTGPAAQAQQSQWCSAMKATSSAPIISAAQSLLEAGRHGMTPERIETIEREIAYLTSNLPRMQYGEFLAKGYFIGSGVVEAGCKTVVGRRLKQSGMFWNQQGGENILALRCMILHPKLVDIWEARLSLLMAERAKAQRWKAAA